VKLLYEFKAWVDKRTPGTADWVRPEILRIRGKGPDNKTIRVLDIGSSDGQVWRNVARESWLQRHKITLIVTLFDASVESRNLTLDGERLVLKSKLGLAPSDLSQFKDTEFDLVSALHVIEHLSKENGYLLLYEINRLAETSIIGTPNGFLWQPPFQDNPFQAHISGWTANELKSMGWKKQFGEGGMKFLIGPGAVPKWKISKSKFRRFVSAPERAILGLSQLFLYHFPSLHAEVLAVRRKRAFDLDGHVRGGGGLPQTDS
jgi:hypothetical protein